MTNPVVIGPCTLYHGDCLEILPTLDPVDCVVTDPPYGIDYIAPHKTAKHYGKIMNDAELIDLRPILGMSCLVVSFGANCYPSLLPHRGRWICWDKRTYEKADKMYGSPFELAWTNRKSGYDKIYRVFHGGAINADGNETRQHPTQKPISLMARIIQDYTKPDDLIFDPFMGSGTTGLACLRTGRRFVGVEMDPKYFEVAKSRITKEWENRGFELFVDTPKKKKKQNDGNMFDLQESPNEG